MKLLSTVFLLINLFSFSQEQERNLIVQDSMSIQATRFMGVDAYQSVYYLKDNILFKQTEGQIISYQNNNLGSITAVDFLNPLAITVFYKDFNTVLQLDNTLSEIKKIDFNVVDNFPVISMAKTASNHRLWMFDENTFQLEIYDYKIQKIKTASQPIVVKIIEMRSNYNYCWLLTQTKILAYNNYGSLINSFELAGYDHFWNQKNYFILQKENQLFLYNKRVKTIEKINLPKIKIKDVFVNAETVYIYNGIKVYTLKFKN